MKRTFLLCLLAMLLFGCQKDNIVTIDPVAVEDADDDIANTTFTQTVYVEFSESGDASVTGTNDDFNVIVSDNDVTIVYSGEECVMYELSGGTTDGFFKLYSTRKQAIALNSVGIFNPNGAAVNVQGTPSEPNKGKRTFIVLNGVNNLADGVSYTDTPSEEDEKGVMFSEGQLIFSGEGRLYVTATGKSGIVSDDYLSFKSGEVYVTSSAGHGIRGKDHIRVSDGDIQVDVSADMKKGFSTDGYVVIEGGLTNINVTGGTGYDDEDGEYTGSAGIKADGYFRMNGGGLIIVNTGTGGKGISCDGNGYFNGGQVEVYAHGNNYGNSSGGGFPGGSGSNTNSVAAKGIKFDGDLMFAGGKVYVNSISHEAIEAKGSITIVDGIVYGNSQSDDAINSGGDMTISGGRVFGASSGNDGLDANGDCRISGGLVFAIGSRSPEVAIDANTEDRKSLYITGGTIIAIGGLENGTNGNWSQSCYQASSWLPQTWYALTVGSKTYAFFTPTSADSRPLVVTGEATPTLQSGVSITGGISYFANLFFEDVDISGGSSVSLSSYTGGNGGGGHGPF
jgi:hypothetical protein